MHWQTAGQIIVWSVISFIGLLLKSTNGNEILKESFCSTFACLSYGYVRVCHILMAYVLLLISYIYQYIIYLEEADEYIQIIIIRQLSQQQKQHKIHENP
jgi:Ni,Fe-hydrogenase I cytochrome b subunit